MTDIDMLDFDAEPLRSRLDAARTVIYLATSADVSAPDTVHYQAMVNVSRLLAACARVPVSRVLLPSSDWAEPKTQWASINTYGHSKRVFEVMAAMYRHSTGQRCAALRIGWVAMTSTKSTVPPNGCRTTTGTTPACLAK